MTGGVTQEHWFVNHAPPAPLPKGGERGTLRLLAATLGLRAKPALWVKRITWESAKALPGSEADSAATIPSTL
jgi:hypothetical protein